MVATSIATQADRNCRRFVWFRVLFNSRFYYPVLAILFIDMGLSAAEYTLLNFAWALVIVFAEVPSGALADRYGRRPLVVAAGACMVVEMLVLCLAPLHGGLVLFLFCLANRILSGLAEALASGADQALAYDALDDEDRSGEWPRVLAAVMRWQSVGMVVAMLLGSAVYDPALVNRLAGQAGLALRFDQGETLLFPVYLNLVSAVAVFAVTLGMREPSRRQERATVSQAMQAVLDAGAWIGRSPLALFVIAAGLLIDSVVRLFLTFGSSYFRLIGLPEASYGLIGAALAGIGMLVSPLAYRMVRTVSLQGNYQALAGLTLFGLVGVAFDLPFWGVAFALPMAAAIAGVDYAVSHYLNAAADSSLRATVLSFKGLAFNLGYGFVSLLFALALRAHRDSGAAGDGLAGALAWLPVWFGFTWLLLLLIFRRHQATLAQRY